MLAEKVRNKHTDSGSDRLRELKALADKIHPKFEAARITVRDIEETAKKVIFGDKGPSR